MKFSARLLGQMIGVTAKEMNLKLRDAGLLTGGPGNWIVTELGKKFSEIAGWDNGYGGYAARGYTYYKWDEKVLDLIKRR